MKKIQKIQILFVLFFSTYLLPAAMAQITNPIVVQSGNNLRYAASLDSALIIATTGDYIYLPAGNFSLSGSINKKVFIYGVGYREDSSRATGTTRIQGNISITSGGSGGLLTGINILGNLNIGNQVFSYLVTNCKMLDCAVSSGGNIGGNFFVKESVIRSVVGNTFTSNDSWNPSSSRITIANSIIEQNISYYRLFIYNCILLTGNISSLYESNLTNNIILATGTASIQTSNLFSNNLIVGNTTYGIDTTNARNLYRTSSFRDSVFESATNNYSETSNYRTKSSCAICADKGIYAGSNPFKPLPNNPHIVEKQVSTTTNNNYLKFKFKIRTSGN